MTSQLEQVLALALQLPVTDRLRLVQHLIASVGEDMAVELSVDEPESEEHWGNHLVQLLDDLDVTGWTDSDADDSAE